MRYLVQVSGGLDSAASLLWARHEGETYPVFYDWGQIYAKQELHAASKLVDDLDLPLHVVKLPLLVDLKSPVLEYIPYRNLVLNAHSLNLAAAQHMDYVVIGAKTRILRLNDPYSFKDSCQEFVDDLNTLSHKITEPKMFWPLILMPLSGWSKVDVLRYLQEHKVDPDQLWTCYRGDSKPCGECYHCKTYAEAKAELCAA